MTLLERILATPCEQCGANPAKPCERYETRHQETYRLEVVCASRIAAAEGAAPCCAKGAQLAQDWVARYKCPVHGWRDNKPSPAPDACPGRRP